jgi:hypothetical protein
LHDCEETEKTLLGDVTDHSAELRDLKADVEGLIQILGLFRDIPYFQPPVVYPEIKQKLDAVVADMRKRHPSLKPFEV